MRHVAYLELASLRLASFRFLFATLYGLLFVTLTGAQIYNTYEEQPLDPGSTNPPNPGLEGYDGGDYGGYGGGGDYWINVAEYTLEKFEPEPVILECYTCHYSKLEYHQHGMPNCDDPFNAQGIPVVVCEGLCAKSTSWLGEDEYMLTRSCMPNCHTIYSDESSVECCYGNRCNGARNTGVKRNAGACALVSNMAAMLLVLITL